MTNLPEIVEMLRHFPWSREAVAEGYVPVLSEVGVDPSKRTKMLVDDMAAIGCGWPIRSIPCGEKMILSHYEIPDSDFGKTDDEDAPEAATAHGSGLNWGSVIRLSKACEIGRKLFGNSWPSSFKGKLLNPKDHLATIEEILWLNLWHGVCVDEIIREASPFRASGCKKKVDWQFTACGQMINLEVKYRPKDWMRHVDGPENNLVMPSYYYDVADKFPKKNPGELNLVSVSTPAPIDRSLRERTEIFLRCHPTIDGVIIWAQESRSHPSPFEIHAPRDKELIELLFTGGDFEDAAHIGIVRHIWRKSEERRNYRADEVPELLRKLASESDAVRDSETRDT